MARRLGLPWEPHLELTADLAASRRAPSPSETSLLDEFPCWGDHEMLDWFDRQGRPRGAMASLASSLGDVLPWLPLAPAHLWPDLADLLWEEAASRADLAGARALDPCPGPGAACRRAPPELGSLVATEPAPVARNAARATSPRAVRVTAVPVWETRADSSYDVVVASAPLRAGRVADPETRLAGRLSATWFAGRCVSALRPGGVAVLVVPERFWESRRHLERIGARADMLDSYSLREVSDACVVTLARRRPGAPSDRSWLSASSPATTRSVAEARSLALSRTLDRPGRSPAPATARSRGASAAETLALDLGRALARALSTQSEGAPSEALLERARSLHRLLRLASPALRGASDRGHPLHALRRFPEWPLIEAAEDSQGRPSPLLSGGSVRARGPVPEDVPGATAACLDTLGRLEPRWVAVAAGLTEGGAEAALSGTGYRDPSGSGWVTADALLSGDLLAARAEAEAAAEADPSFGPSLAALQAAEPGEEPFRAPLGACWVPPEAVREFCGRLLGRDAQRWGVTVSLVPETFTWQVACGSATVERSVENTSTWGTRERGFLEILEDGLNRREPRVRLEGSRDTDEEATFSAETKLEQIRGEWDRWQEAEGLPLLAPEFRRRFGALRRRRVSGSHLSLPGLALRVDGREFVPRPSQLDAAERVASPSSPDDTFLVVHKVGQGKTFAGVAGLVRRWQLGRSDRNLVVTPGGRVAAQWRERFRAYWPEHSTRLSAPPPDASPGEVADVLGRFASGGSPFCLLTYEQAGAVPLSPAAFRAMIMDPVEELEREAEDADSPDREVLGRSARARRRAAEALRERHDATWDRLSAGGRTPLSWEDLLGEPSRATLAFDEWHLLKNIPLHSRMTVSGLPGKESGRAADFLAKSDWLLAGGGRCGGFTATPVTNSLAEVWVAMRWFQRNLLARLGLLRFDSWASTFTEPASAAEQDATGRYRSITRLRFVNLRPLTEALGLVWDFAPPDSADLPGVAGGKPEIVEVPGSEALAEYVRDLADRAELVRAGEVRPAEDNMLKITGNGRLAAMFNGPPAETFPEHPTKVDALADKVWEYYSRYHAEAGTQLVFCDSGTPKGSAPPGAADAERFRIEGVYGEIRRRLVDRGILPSQIAFVHDARTDRESDRLFEEFNAGRVRVLLGSTGKLGVGTNPQRRVVAVHNLDCTWRPDELIQREGRGRRPNNLWTLVHVLHYVTTRSYDVCLWQLVQAKADFLSRFQSGEADGRSADDVGELVITAAMARAIALGDERALRKVRLEDTLAHLDRQAAEWARASARAAGELAELPGRVSRLSAEHSAVRAARGRLAEDAVEFRATLRDVTSLDPRLVRSREEGDARAYRLANVLRPVLRRPVPVGEWRGFRLLLESRYGAPCLVLDLAGAEICVHNVRPSGTFAELAREAALLGIREVALERALEAEEARRAALRADAGRAWPKRAEARALLDDYEALCADLAAGGPVDRERFNHLTGQK